MRVMSGTAFSGKIIVGFILAPSAGGRNCWAGIIGKKEGAAGCFRIRIVG
ncbi:hypothetical protein LHA01_23880 [Schleiferilactobacillus harbinensis]|nr:hypothetical protein LHA01_23880 [Schleiferilactobacillus harbinensis]